MAHCLFTGAELDGDTRDEHTIQRSLGGRVRSTLVSSTDFNERSGQRLDPYLAGVYADIMRVLGPALPAEARSGAIEFAIPGQPGRWRITELGQLTLAAPAVIDRDPETRRPRSAIGPDLLSLEPMISQLGTPAVRRSEMLPPSNEVIFPERPVLHWRIELAVLKAVLLTFDHLLQDDPQRFTRSPAIQAVRDFVREIVATDDDSPNTDLLAEISLGIQYDADYLAIYRQLREESRIPASPFAHTLIVSANLATRTLDVVFWAFETDPYAFRLSSNWTEPGFTYVMCNGVLLNTESSRAIAVSRTEMLGRPTNRRCRMRVRVPMTDAQRQATGLEISAIRQDLYRRAVDFVERNCDATTQDLLSRLARLNSLQDHRLSSAVFSHLSTLFAGGTRTNASADRFMEILIPIIDSAPDDVSVPSEPNAIPFQGWTFWLDLYRACLDSLRDEFGLPGHIFTAGHRNEMNIS